MKTATHTGTCQLCGREQKLPGELLSKHGYAVEWSMFVGTCPGSDHLPFELSINLVDAAIARALVASYAYRTNADETEALTSTVWVHEYTKDARGRGDYQWRLLRVADVSFAPYAPASIDTWTGADGKMHRSSYYGDGSTVAAFNKRRAEYLRREAETQERYIEWQQRRIKRWAPDASKLKPVVEDARTFCSGSGEYLGQGYIKCPNCKLRRRTTRTGIMPKHEEVR